MAAWFLLAQAVPLESATSLPFSPLKLILLVGWACFCLYLTPRLKDNPLVPSEYESLFQVATLLGGPLVILVLVLTDTRASARDKSFWDRLKDAMLGTMGVKPMPVEESGLQLFDANGAELSRLYGHGEAGPGDRHVLAMTVQIIEEAVRQRASDILIDPKDHTSYAVRLRVDGALRTLRILPAATSRAVLNSVKAVSSMDLAERRRPQDGAFTARKGDTSVSFRVASSGALNGEKLSIRILNQNAGRFTLADVGIPEQQRSIILGALGKPFGMVLVCGPTGSGKTTTLYSMLNAIDRQTRNVISVEDPIEAHLPNVSQIEINAKAKITFASSLRSILRQDPDVICVGEIRDEETAEIAVRAAQTGHLVLATMHCDSNPTALIRLLDLGVSPMLLSSGLSLLMTQRLVRKLCRQCKRPARLSPAAAEGFRKRGIDPGRMFQAAGCDACGGTGYLGRLAVCDLLSVTDELRTEIANNPGLAAKLRSEGEKKSRTNLKNEAFRLVVAGITSLDEFKRVVG
ncbi:MAG: type II/IV secretion system protein [Pirellulales bacterium]|nr:type II/IV secretion system protein [Pirellulales bacterium]